MISQEFCNDYFMKPTFIESVGNIYPIKVQDYEEFKYGSNKLLYNEENGLIILTDKKDKIMDIQSLPKEFIYSLLKEDIDKKDIENLVDENIKSLEEDSLNTSC